MLDSVNSLANSQLPEAPISAIRRRLDPAILIRSRVVIIGLGGIGLYLARAIVTFLSGLRGSLQAHEDMRIVLCDGDAFEIGNRYRMDIPGYGNKAVVLGQELLGRLECSGLSIRWVAEHVGTENVAEIIQEGDLVLLACDNHATRHLVGQRCAGGAMKNVVLISGGNDGVEAGFRGTYGNVQVYVREDGRDLTAPIDRFHPEIAHPADQLPDAHDCVQAGATSTPQLSIVNLAVASAMCNALLRLIMTQENEPPYDEATFDVFDAACVPHYFSNPQTDSRE